MGPRARSSPKKTLSEASISSNAEDNGSDVNDKKTGILQRYMKLAGYSLLILSILGLFFYLGTLTKGDTGNSHGGKGSDKAVISENKMELKVHWVGEEATLLKDGDEDADACILLSQCFKSAYFTPDPVKFPENPLKQCHATLRSLLSSFDSGFYFNGPRLVGFISSEYKNTGAYSKVILYNVCVRSEERGKGIAKGMVPEYVKAVVGKRIAKDAPKVYVGLDVDFDTETAVSAFALYAKMGFNRWWEPCSNVSYFNFNRLEHQHLLANPVTSNSDGFTTKSPAYVFPMSDMVLARQAALSKKLYDRNGVPYTHFCMIMLLGADDFGSIGKDIKDTIQSALKR